MGDYVQPVKNGEVQQTKNTADSKPKNDLDKNAFLQLLTTQMKYQDPLNPNTDTEYIAQLATFSQLEQLQNLSTVTANSQAFGLVGKYVTVKTENTSGDTSYVSGRVDNVVMSGTKAQLFIDGNLYPIDKLDSVSSDEYILKQNLPGIVAKTDLKYDAAAPKDLTLEVKLGSGDTVATKVAIGLNGKVIDTKYVNVSGNKVTISKDAFTDLENGSYSVTVAFNDPMLTTVPNMVTLQVVNSQAGGTPDGTADDTAGNTADTGTTSGTTTNSAEGGEV